MGNGKGILKNISYTLFSNLIAFAVSAIVTFIVPKRLGVESYGYFQLYLFYSSYTGFLHFGWADGLFLRYGGAYYDELNKPLMKGQFVLYFIMVSLLGLMICLISFFVNIGSEKANVLLVTGFVICIHLPRTLLQYILQSTNRLKEYAFLVTSERVIYICAIILYLLSGSDSYMDMMFSDAIGKFAALAYAMYQCRDILSAKACGLHEIACEAKENIKVGIKLMFANIASFLIIGIVRMSIEHQWDVATFGKISLTMSVSNLLMVFIRAVSLVMFPVLRRTNSDQLSEIYLVLRNAIMVLLLGMLILYCPAKEVLGIWLPQYADSLKYMALLFPMCVFESKMSMLIETYMKTLRQEKHLLIINLLTVLVSAVLSILCVFVLRNLTLAVLSIVVLIAFRCITAELIMAKSLNVSVKKDIVMELILACAFILSSWLVGNDWGVLIYLLAYLVYVMIKWPEINHILRIVIRRMK